MTPRFIPDVDPASIPFDSERRTYEALRALPSRYVVLHSLPWTRPHRDALDGPLHEGEADFVVIDPLRGLLVLEVKGGQVELRDRRWLRAGKPIRDPFEQARRSRYVLLAAIEDATRKAVRREQLVHGDVVVFPHQRYEGALPLHAPEAIVLDELALQDVGGAIERAFAAWDRSPGAARGFDLSRVLEVLTPRLRLVRCVGAEIESEAARIVQLTRDQQATLVGLAASPRVLVEGAAGSGKTMLALEFAVERARRGDAVLVLCFNRHLAAWMNERLAEEPRLRGAGGRVIAESFHAYALGLARAQRVEFSVPGGDEAQGFWDEEAPLLLEQAMQLAGEGGPRFDAVVVDEAQDFSPLWWMTIEALTTGGPDGRLYVFLDRHQSLRREYSEPLVVLPTRLELPTNLRNTRAITESSGRLAGIEVRAYESSPAGEPPRLLRPRSHEAVLGLVQGALGELLAPGGVQPDQIAIIGPAGWRRGSLQGRVELNGVPVTDDAAAWRAGGTLLVTTARAFKGLEADVVVLYDLAGYTELFTRADLYVAWTRAKHRVLAICESGELRAGIERALQPDGGGPP